MNYQSNCVVLGGQIISEVTFSHETNGESFYSCLIGIKRTSGINDILPLIISGRILNDELYGKYVRVFGSVRTRNEKTGEKVHLRIYVFVDDIEILDEEENENSVMLDGYLCCKQSLRETPLGRVICDGTIAVNRQNRSDYIPCVFWGKTAKWVNKMNIGEHLIIEGRLQSREYTKNEITNTVYELSINKVEQVLEESSRKTS